MPRKCVWKFEGCKMWGNVVKICVKKEKVRERLNLWSQVGDFW